MRIWKKITGVFLTGMLVFSLTACGNSGTQSTGNQDQGAESTADSTTENDAQNSQDNGTESDTQNGADNTAQEGTISVENTLIAYFSHTGNTEEVAGLIADYTGGTLVQIERAEPYDDVNAQGEEELNSNARPEITVNLDSIENYDHIFIGYPIWWDEAPMVIDTFLESYDFSGKTIIPFCTSASDPIDNSLHIFQELAPDAVIEERFTANDTADIQPWLESLGYAAGQ